MDEDMLIPIKSSELITSDPTSNKEVKKVNPFFPKFIRQSMSSCTKYEVCREEFIDRISCATFSILKEGRYRIITEIVF